MNHPKWRHMPNPRSKYSHLVIVFNNLNIGGIERKIIDITNYYCQQPSTKVTLILKDKTGALLDQLKPKVNVISPTIIFSRQIDAVRFSPWLIFQFLKLKPTLILTFGNYSSICAIASRMIIFSKCPLIISEDSSIITQLNNDTYPTIRKFLVKTLYPFSTKIITLTASGSKKLNDLLPGNSEKLTTLPNWLPLNFSTSTPDTSKRAIDILFLGRFEPQKDPLLFLKICKDIIVDLPNLKVSMYGHGSMKNQIKQFISKNHLASNITIQPATLETPTVFKNSRLMLLTSVHEGFPLTILESTASGCLPICKSISEIVPFFSKDPQYLLFKTQLQAIISIKYLLQNQKSVESLVKFYQKRSLSHQISDFEKTINFLNQYLWARL